jgi:hypothetical protein
MANSLRIYKNNSIITLKAVIGELTLGYGPNVVYYIQGGDNGEYLQFFSGNNLGVSLDSRLLTNDFASKLIQSGAALCNGNSFKWDEIFDSAGLPAGATLDAVLDYLSLNSVALLPFDLSGVAQETTLQDIKDLLENISLEQKSSYDAAGALRVSQKIVTGHYILHRQDILDLFFDKVSSGGNANNWASGVNEMTVNAGSGNYAIAQTNQRHLYIGGKSSVYTATFDKFAAQTNTTKRVGFFTSNTSAPYDSNKDGIWIESSAGAVSLNIQKNGTSLLSITQASWNVNNLTGHNWDKFNVFSVDFLYLGGTGVAFYIFIGRVKTLVHTYSYASIVAQGTFITTPFLPIRYEIRSSGGAGSMGMICAEASVEGVVDTVGTSFGLFTGQINYPAANTLYLAKGYRLNNPSTFIDIVSTSVLSTSNDNFQWELIFNPTFSAAPASAALAFSSINELSQTSPGATITVSGAL